MNFFYLNFFLTLFISLLSLIQSQDNQESKLKEIEENISQINSLYQNLTEKMTDIKYNVVLKLRYKSLARKKDKVEKQLNKIKSSGTISEYSLSELREYVYSYGKSCRKVQKLFDTFENLKNTIINKFSSYYFFQLLIFHFFFYHYHFHRHHHLFLPQDIFLLIFLKIHKTLLHFLLKSKQIHILFL